MQHCLSNVPRQTTTEFRYSKAIGYVVLLISVAVILCLLIESENAREAGGIVGGFLKETVLIPSVWTHQRRIDQPLCAPAIPDASDSELASGHSK